MATGQPAIPPLPTGEGRGEGSFVSLGSPLVFGILAFATIPLAFHLVSIYRIYYFWMSFIPLAICLCAALDSSDSTTRSSRSRCAGEAHSPSWIRRALLRWFTPALLALACLVGLPIRLFIAVTEWQGRDYDPVIALVKRHVDTHSFVFCDFAAYYAVKLQGAKVFLPTCVNVMTEAEKARVSLAVASPGALEPLSQLLGGDWRDTGDALQPKLGPKILGLREDLDARKYQLHIFKRIPGHDPSDRSDASDHSNH